MFDDGVIARLDAERFIVSCSTSHVAGVHARLEDWRQDQFDPSRLYIHNATPHWTTLTSPARCRENSSSGSTSASTLPTPRCRTWRWRSAGSPASRRGLRA